MAVSRGILEGHVADDRTGQPLFGANVMIQGTLLGAATDREGNFQINNVPAGTYTIQVRMMGYRTLNIEKVEIRSNLRTKLDHIRLEESAVEVEALVVRAERPLIQKDVTGSSMRVSEERLRRLPVTTFQDILPLQAGVTDEGHVRGGKSTEVLYMLDGLSMQDVISGGVGVHLPGSAVTQIEIQTGGFDSEYGNALSGVVNVITKSGTPDFQVSLLGETDDFPGITQKDRASRVDVSVSGPVVADHVFFFLSAEGSLTDTRWWQDLEREYASPFQTEYSGFGKVDYHITPSLRLSAQGAYSTRNWKDYEFSWRYNLTGLPARKRDVGWAGLQWSHVLSERTFYSLNFSFFDLFSKIGEGNNEGTDLSPYEYDFYLRFIVSGKRSWWAETRQRIYTLQGDITSQITPYHLFKSGFEFHMYDIFGDIVKYEPQMTYFGKPLLDEPLLNYSTRYDYYPRSGSVYVQDKFELPHEGGVLSAGLRWDFLDPRAERPMVELVPAGEDEYEGRVTEWVKASFKNTFSPRIGFSAPLFVRGFFFANIGMYTQFPLFQYMYAGIDNVTLRSGMNVLKGNPDLKPEQNLVWEVSFKYTIPWNGVLSLTYFSKQIENQVDSKTFVPSNSRIAGDYGFAEYVNNDRAEASGFEFNITREYGEWVTGSLSYTYMNAKGMSGSAEQGIAYYQWGFPLNQKLYYLSWDQRHTFKANLNMSLPWGVELSLYYQYHTPRPFTYYPSADGYTPDNPDMAFVPNNERMDDFQLMNVKLSESIALRGVLKRVTLFVDSRNLFDTHNVMWIDASGRIGGELGDPGAYAIGRRTRVGLQIEF